MPNVAPTPPSAKGESTELIRLPITCIRTDGGTQPRGRLDDATVERYAGDMRDGIWDWSRSSTPIVGFYDGTDHWCGDGYHRIAAAKKAGLTEVEVEVRPGTLREARWFSFSVNAEHGYARGRDDVARILEAIFEDDEWRAIPLREIARHTRVPLTTVHRYHERYVASVPPEQMAKPVTRTVSRAGTTYPMNVAAIGNQAKSPAPPAPPAVQLEAGSAVTELPGGGDITDLGEAQAAVDAEPATTSSETAYDSGTQQLLKQHLSRNDFPSVVRHPARRVAAAARTFTPKTLTKIRQRMERYRQWIADFLAALDEAAER